MRDRILYTIVIGFAFGIGYESLFMKMDSVSFFFFIISIPFLALYFIGNRKYPWLLFCAAFIASFGFGIMHMEHAISKSEEARARLFIGKSAVIDGMISEAPDMRDQNVKLTVNVEKINGKEYGDDSKVLVTTDRTKAYEYGDKVHISGKILEVQNFTTDQGREFDYISYLKKDGIYAEIKNPDLTITAHGEGNMLLQKLYRIRFSFLRKIESLIPEPESALLGGLILGTKQSLGNDLRQSFIKTGTIHIVALSGYNVTIVAEAIMRFFGMIFYRTLSIYFGIVSIILFALLAGGGATAIRASIMAILALIARATGRTYDIGRALVLAGFFMLLWNPWTLIFDVSFELSFLATIGLIYFAPRIKHWFFFLTEKAGIRELVTATVATNIFVLPFIIYKMGIISVVALPANILVLPLIPYTMLFGFVAALAGFISHALAFPFGYITYGLLHYELSVITWFSKLSFAAITAPEMPVYFLVISYGILLWVTFASNRKIPLS